ncbi:WD repeat protein [Sarocladium implicatum]|nr:WD repeat protein [Sarocladium implicatum]
MYNRDSKIMRKLLGKATYTHSSSTADLTSAGADATASSTASLPAALRPTNSQNAVYAAGAPVACLDVAADRRAAVIGGPHVLKTVILDDPKSFDFRFSEGVDVRAHIMAQPSTGSKVTAMTDQLNIRDVKWHENSKIFTACANGNIFAYDLARMSVGGSEALDYIQIHEDSRQVNTLDVNPHLKSWLLSGGQDGMVRVFDTSATWQNRSGYVTFKQRYNPLRCNEPIKKVQWSPRVGHEMACCTDAGVILKWDIRQSGRPMLKINAHEKACSTIAWHPDGIHLISGGADSKLHVWDLGPTADKRQKPKWTISTPAPVATAAWRPGLWSASAQSRRAAQVAVTYDDSGNQRYGVPVVQIWDLARPTMPYKEIQRFDSSPSAISWQSQDMLWTVGADGMFNQCDVAYAPNVMDRQSTSTMAFSPRGDVVMFLDERLPRARTRPHITSHSETTSRGASYATSPTGPMLSISKSDSEEDTIGSFLGPRRRERHHSRRTSGRSAYSMSTTPPSASSSLDEHKHMMGLDQSVKFTGSFRLQQTMASGHVPAAKTVESYGFLSSVYLETLGRDLPAGETGKTLVERVTNIMETFAQSAEVLSLFRLSQTWRVLAFAIKLLLDSRAIYHQNWRLARLRMVKGHGPRLHDTHRLDAYDHKGSAHGEDTPRQGSRGGGESTRLLSGTSAADDIDSTSNIATPRARPVDHVDNVDYQDHVYHHGKRLSPIIEPESFSLGTVVQTGPFAKESPRRRLDSAPISFMSQESETSQSSITEGYDFYDADVLAQAIDVPRPAEGSGAARRGPTRERQEVARHDSEESYGQMFSISNGTKQSLMPHASPQQNGTKERKDSDASGGSAGSDDFESRLRSSLDLHGRESWSESSPEDVFMISQTTATSDETYPSQDSLPLRRAVAPERPSPIQPQAQTPATIESAEASPVIPPWFDDSPDIVESDYLPWPEDPPYPFPTVPSGSKATLTPTKTPLEPYTLIRRALEFECKTSALTPSAIILLLKPLLPDSVIDAHHASAILRQHHSRLMRMGLFVEATLLRNLCLEGWPGEGMETWGEDHPAIYQPAQRNIDVHFFCAACRKPKELDPGAREETLWTCQNCGDVMAPCAVCGHREPQLAASLPETPEEGDRDDVDSWLLGWWQCPGCYHGGHASCLQIWHTTFDSSSPDPYSDGCCPLDGCGHACLPGKYRGETTTARSEELSRAAAEAGHHTTATNTPVGSRPGSGRSSPRLRSAVVRSDGNDVPQSRAVGMAREALNGKGGGAGSTAFGGGSGSGGGILSSSPRERERRKSVKFAKTDRPS